MYIYYIYWTDKKTYKYYRVRESTRAREKDAYYERKRESEREMRIMKEKERDNKVKYSSLKLVRDLMSKKIHSLLYLNVLFCTTR